MEVKSKLPFLHHEVEFLFSCINTFYFSRSLLIFLCNTIFCQIANLQLLRTSLL